MASGMEVVVAAWQILLAQQILAHSLARKISQARIRRTRVKSVRGMDEKRSKTVACGNIPFGLIGLLIKAKRILQ